MSLLLHSGWWLHLCDSKNFLLSQFTGSCSQPGTKVFLMLPSYSTNPHIGQVLAISSADAHRISFSSKLKHSISLSFDYYNPFLFLWLIIHSWHLHKFSPNFAEIILLFVTGFFSPKILIIITDLLNLHVAFPLSHTCCFPLKHTINIQCLNVVLTSDIPRTA